MKSVKNYIFVLFCLAWLSANPTAVYSMDYVDVTNHGAIPNDSLDDQAAIRAALDYALSNGINTVVFPEGTYDIVTANSLSPATLPNNPTLHLIGRGNAVIKKSAASPEYDFFFNFYSSATSGIMNLRLTNLTLDGGNKIATGVYVYSGGTRDNAYLIVENSRFVNFRQVGAVTTSAAAISANAEFTTVAIRDSAVKGISRESLPMFSSGIEISQLIGTATVSNVDIRNVTTPSDADADCVKIFGKTGPLGDMLGKGVIRDSYFENCEGRAVKFQTTDAIASSNTVVNKSGKMITNHHSFDAQSGGAIFTHNKVSIYGTVTVGVSAMPFIIQSSTNAYAPHAVIEGNIVLTDKPIPYFTAVEHPTATRVKHIIRNNVVSSYSGENSGTVSTFCKYSFNPDDVFNKHLSLVLEGNIINSGWRFLLFSNQGTSYDMRPDLSLTLINNQNVEDAPRSLTYDSDKIKLDKLTLYENTGWSPASWYGYLDGEKIGDGSSIYYGSSGDSGSLVNGHPTETSWVMLERRQWILRSQRSTGKDVHQTTIPVSTWTKLD